MTHAEKVAKAKAAQQSVWAARDAYHAALADAYPLQMHTYYSHGKHWVGCTVTGYSHGSLRVVGDASGKEYLICGSRFWE